MADALGSLVISLVAETAAFRSELEKGAYQVSSSVGQMTTELGKLQGHFARVDEAVGAFGTSLRALFGLTAAGGLAAFVTSAVNAETTMLHLAQRTGTTVEALSALSPAAKLSETSLDSVAAMSGKLSKSLLEAGEGGNKATQVLQQLGFTSTQIKGFLDQPATALYEIAKRLNDFPDSGQKAAAAMILFGKSGSEALPFLKALGEQTELVGKLTTEQAERAETFKRALIALEGASNSLARKIGDALIPAFTGIVTGFKEMNDGADKSTGIWSSLGEVFRVGALGAATLGATVKNIAVDFAALGAAIAAVATLSPKSAFDAIFDKRNEDIEANNAALLRFYDSVAKGSPLLATLAGRQVEAGEAAKKHAEGAGKLNIELGGSGGTNATIAEFINKLNEQAATLGYDSLALEEFKAAQLGVSDAVAQSIQDIREFNTTLGLLKASQKEADDELKVYIDLGKKANDARNEEIKTEKEVRDAIELETKLLGLNGIERERQIALRRLEIANGKGLVQNYEEERAALNALFDRKGLAQGAIDAADQVNKAWLDTAKTIEDGLIQAFDSWSKGAKSIGQSLADSLKRMFEQLVLRPILQPIAQGIAGSLVSGVAGATGLGGTAANGVVGGVTNSLIGNSISSGFSSLLGSIGTSTSAGLFSSLGGAGSAQAAALAAQTAGFGVEGTAATLGALGAEGAATALSFVPVVGWALAAAAIAYSIFGNKGGGPKGGGFGSTGGFDRYFTPNDQDRTLSQLASGTQSAYNATLASLGGSGAANFAFGFDTDPQGTAQDRLSAGATVNGRSVYSIRDQNQGRGDSSTLQANLQLESQRALLAALQASDLPKAIAGILNSIVASGASADAITRVTTAATAYKTLGDIIGGNAMQDALKGLTTQSQGAFGALSQMGEGLRSLISSYKGTTDQTLALVTASNQYYAAEVALLQQTQQVRQGLASMFTDTIRGFRLSALDGDKPGQYAYLQQEAQTLRGQLGTATDPNTINTLVSQINADLNQAFGLLDVGQRQSVLDQFIQSANDLNAAAQERLQLIEDTTQQGVRDTLAEAQQLIADTADTLRETAEMQQAAAQTQLDAANTPINITFTTNVPGTTETNLG